MEDTHYKYNTLQIQYVDSKVESIQYKCVKISHDMQTDIKYFTLIKPQKPDYLDLWCQWYTFVLTSLKTIWIDEGQCYICLTRLDVFSGNNIWELHYYLIFACLQVIPNFPLKNQLATVWHAPYWRKRKKVSMWEGTENHPLQGGIWVMTNSLFWLMPPVSTVSLNKWVWSHPKVNSKVDRWTSSRPVAPTLRVPWKFAIWATDF